MGGGFWRSMRGYACVHDYFSEYDKELSEQAETPVTTTSTVWAEAMACDADVSVSDGAGGGNARPAAMPFEN